MKTIRMISVLSLLLSVSYHSVMAQATPVPKSDDVAVLLRYHFHPNDVRKFKMVMVQNIQQEIQGQEMTTKQTIGMGYQIKVISVDDNGNASTKLTYKSVQFKMEMPAGKIDYDSTQPNAQLPPGAEGFAGLLGETIAMKFAPDGQVLQVEGVDEMMKHVLGKSTLPDDMRATMEQGMKNQFGDKAMKQMFEQVTRIYPAQAVKVGTTWSRHAETETGMALILDSTYTLTERSKGISYITVRTTCKANPKGAPMDMGAIKIAYDLSGGMEGKMEINEATGWPRLVKMTQKLSGTMNMEGPQLPQAMTVPVSIEGGITATIE